MINPVREFWVRAITPIYFLALLAQLGGYLTMLMQTSLLAANRINMRKFLVRVGTANELLTNMSVLHTSFA